MNNKDYLDLPWSVWPWQCCRARHVQAGRCELRKKHDGPHARDYGMHPWLWIEVDPV